jgi:hypothetical protein
MTISFSKMFPLSTFSQNSLYFVNKSIIIGFQKSLQQYDNNVTKIGLKNYKNEIHVKQPEKYILLAFK